ncbi:MAG TPA: hypothetical protein VJP86_06940, partial [Vicinamibacterales bacterium]|nr:hypothetical protein [Vicinamibacterales bacterium]
GNSNVYPEGNFFPSEEEFRRHFVDYDGRDFRLTPGNPWTRPSRSSARPGADVAALTGAGRDE